MAPNLTVERLPLVLRANPSRVVIRPFVPADDPTPVGTSAISRAQCLADRVLALDPMELQTEWARVVASLADRHRNVEDVLMRRFHEVNGGMIAARAVSDAQAAKHKG